LGRPNLKEERSEQILSALMRCVARFGLEGASLESIATEAGVKRSILRHYLGNRDQLIETFAEFMVGKYQTYDDLLFETLPDDNPIAALIERMFATYDDPEVDDVAMAHQALVIASQTHPEIRKLLQNWYLRFVTRLAETLAQGQPISQDHRAAAHGLCGLYFNHISVDAIGLGEEFQTTSCKLAHQLVRGLDLSVGQS
jgi:AcrR family transcriptional regulator